VPTGRVFNATECAYCSELVERVCHLRALAPYVFIRVETDLHLDWTFAWRWIAKPPDSIVF